MTSWLLPCVAGVYGRRQKGVGERDGCDEKPPSQHSENIKFIESYWDFYQVFLSVCGFLEVFAPENIRTRRFALADHLPSSFAAIALCACVRRSLLFESPRGVFGDRRRRSPMAREPPPQRERHSPPAEKSAHHGCDRNRIANLSPTSAGRDTRGWYSHRKNYISLTLFQRRAVYAFTRFKRLSAS